MKALLMHRDRDFDSLQEISCDADALTRDLELTMLWHAMAGNDEFLIDVARKTLFAGLHNDIDTILYRHAVLQDCLKNPTEVRQLYDFAVETIDNKKKHFFSILSDFPSAILRDSIEMLQMFMGVLKTLRQTARSQASSFHSEAFINLFAMIERELGDDYLARIQGHLTELKFKDGVLLSTELGKGNRSTHYIVRRAPNRAPCCLLYTSDAADE